MKCCGNNENQEEPANKYCEKIESNATVEEIFIQENIETLKTNKEEEKEENSEKVETTKNENNSNNLM